MDRATKVAVEKYPLETYQEIGDSLRVACIIGYLQAEKDLAITAEDVCVIFNLVRKLQVKCADTTGCYQEVADVFNKARKEGESWMKDDYYGG